MGLAVGIVGLPNVGKSTLFNALLKKQQALAANYPFATIEPNVGVVPVPDRRLAALAAIIAGGNPQEILKQVQDDRGVEVEADKWPPMVPATVEFVDIAGIVEGASKGEGLGNKFLSHIREVDLIAHVVRDFDDSDVVQTGKGLEEDYEAIINELIFKDLETIEAQKLKVKKQNNNSKLKIVLEKLTQGFNEGKRAAEILVGDEVEEVRELFLITMKPRIIVVNVGEEELKSQKEKVDSVAKRLGVAEADIVVISAKIESEIAGLEDEDAKMFMEELGIAESGLERLIRTAYNRLGLISFLTAGEKEVRAWTIERGTRAQMAAGVIHTDFINKFIKAEVVAFDDFVAVGGWKGARENGKVRLEGRDYVVVDGDVVDFKIGS